MTSRDLTPEIRLASRCIDQYEAQRNQHQELVEAFQELVEHDELRIAYWKEQRAGWLERMGVTTLEQRPEVPNTIA